MQDTNRLLAIMDLAPVVPVVVVDVPDAAVGLARALLAGGIPTIEITFRTARALDCLKAVTAEVPEMVVGAGTVLDGGQLDLAHRAGAAFAVSPGAAAALLDAAAGHPLPLLPGVATASEAMTLLERGYAAMKFFPAEPAGGVVYLQALASPLPQAQFCPTGGITQASASSYLALANVRCVGGSWLAPKEALAAADWQRITRLARAAAALGGHGTASGTLAD